jgi:hypothetical protein
MHYIKHKIKTCACFMCCCAIPAAITDAADATATAASTSTTTAAKAEPFSLESSLGTPDWLDLGFENTTRYESLDNQFRSGYTGSDQILLIRSLLNVGVKFGNYGLVTEFIDCRQELADSGTRLTTSLVDPTDILQAYASATFKDVISGDIIVHVGRQTVDLGSRRFIARQSYRLTINSFDGIDVQWKNSAGINVHAFYFQPVNIRPTTTSELLDNKDKLDESTSGTKFYGAFASFSKLPLVENLETYAFFLNEKDSDEYPTADQDLCTPGFRLFSKAAKNKIDYEIEAAGQFGESYSSTKATDTKKLDNTAWMTHLGLGYTFGIPWTPRLSVEYDYASGDKNPSDDKNEHFNSLYGVARGDLGPTSLYGAMSRTNISSPGLRLGVKPVKGWDAMICDRFVWLASDTDSWCGVRDKTGESGDYVGNQIELRIRWEAIPKNLKFETGMAYLFAGSFMEDAPNSPDQGNAMYSYVMMTITL